MIHPAGEFVVYACDQCGKRIFTERSHLGQRGRCPVCRASHVVGGTPSISAEEGVERRRAPRVPMHNARVSVQGESEPLVGAHDLFELQDLSETGMSFDLVAVADPDAEEGSRAPALGDTIQVTLHARELFRPRTYRGEIRRVLPSSSGRGYTVGVQFTGLSPEQQAELSALVRRLGAQAD